MLAWLNGAVVDDATRALSAHDRGFLLGDGAFETLRAHGDRVLWLADHLARLRDAAGTLAIPIRHDDAAIAAGLATLLDHTRYERSALRVTLSRGPAAQRGLWPAGAPVAPTLLATVAPLHDPAAVRLITARSTRRNERSPLSRMKSLNYGDNLLARLEAQQRGADDAVMLNTVGRVACATTATIFVRIGGDWITPPTGDGALPGLARARILAGGSACEATLEERDLARATAVVLANSLGCAPVAVLDGRALFDARDELGIASLYR